jgi:hypothetical protein
MTDIFNIIGIIGTFITILAYLLSSFSILKVGILYQTMNFFGSAMLVISLVHHFNLPALIMEASWCLISILALSRIAFGKKTEIS